MFGSDLQVISVQSLCPSFFEPLHNPPAREISGIAVSLEISGIVVSLEIPVFPIFARKKSGKIVKIEFSDSRDQKKIEIL